MGPESEEDFILVKYFEDGELIEESFFQKATRATALFEFIGRQDIYLENMTVSLSPESSKKKIEQVFPNTSEVSLDIIPFDSISQENTIAGSENMDILDTIIISDSNSPVKGCNSTNTIAPCSPINNVIVISDSPKKTSQKRIQYKDLTSSSSSDEQNRLPILKRKRIKLSHHITAEKQRNYAKGIIVSSESDEEITETITCNKNMYDTRSLTPKPVEKLPNNINGNVAFQLHYDNKERQKMKSSQDGRSWKRYNKSYTYYFKSSHGTRLRASCKGSFRCKNSGCPYLKYYNSENSQRVLKEGDETNCEECGGEMEFIHCDAVKIWQFPRDKNFVNVYHFGDHTCPVINKPYPPVDQIKSMYELNPDFKPCEVSSKLIMNKVETAASREEVEDMAFNLVDDSKARNIKQSVVGKSGEVCRKLFELQNKCVDIYKDPYLLYKFQMLEQNINTSSCKVILSEFKKDRIVKSEWTSNEKNYVFVLKSSKEKLKLLTEIMKLDDIMGEEYVYVDFKENRIKGKGKNLKTLGLSVYHVILKKVVWLVRMDCEKEDKETVLLFLKGIDEMLKQYSDQQINEFRPASGWMMDEGGGLHSALETKYGAIYCQDKVVTCQLHLNMCRNRHTSSVFIGNDGKEQKIVELRKKINDMVHSTTVNQYNSQYNEVKRFITENNKSSLLKWLQWWDKRRNHVMDAYRDVSAPNTNLAEVSHASTTHCGGSNLNLIQTAVFDISDCFKYAQAVKGYFSGVVKAGSGPSYQRKQMILDQKANNRAESLLHELDDQFEGGKAPQLPKQSTFMAEPSASHRADKSSDKDKRPIGKTRTNNSKEFNLRIEKARAMGDYKCIEVNIHSPMQATVSLVSPQGETYAVYFDQKSTCSCPFSKLQSTEKLRKVACKHRMFILICLNYSQTCNIIKQYSYTLTEVGDIVNRLDAFALEPNSLKLNIPSTSNYSDLKNRYWHLTSSDPFELTYLHGIISKCYGCDKKYTDINRKPPFDVIIKHLEVRPRFNKDKKEWYISANKEKSNAYYHLQTDCMQKVHPNFKAGDIIITNELRQTLSEEHRHYLTNLGIEL